MYHCMEKKYNIKYTRSSGCIENTRWICHGEVFKLLLRFTGLGLGEWSKRSEHKKIVTEPYLMSWECHSWPSTLSHMSPTELQRRWRIMFPAFFILHKAINFTVPLHRIKIRVETPSKIILGHLNHHPLMLVKGMASKSQGLVNSVKHTESDACIAFLTPSWSCLETQSACLRTFRTLEAESMQRPPSLCMLPCSCSAQTTYSPSK